jgi:hypothetical protein
MPVAEPLLTNANRPMQDLGLCVPPRVGSLKPAMNGNQASSARARRMAART